MHNSKELELTQYLADKGIQIIRNEAEEIVVGCVFGSCDADSKGNEAHLYFSKETGQYHCKKCQEAGNLITLKKFFGDFEINAQQKKLNTEMDKFHNALPKRIREYLNERGISDTLINKSKLGFANVWKSNPTQFITIPILDNQDNCKFFKVRQDPAVGTDKCTYPNGVQATLYGQIKSGEELFITEGEFDALCLIDKGYNAVTSTHGAGTWNKDWNDKIKVASKIFVCYDTDKTGKNGSVKVLNSLWDSGIRNLHQVNLPDLNGKDKTDITDYVAKYKLDISELITKYAVQFPSLVSTEDLIELTVEDIENGLEPTIKFDNTNKLVAFLGMITAYTEDSQMNLLFNAQSSTGKSHIALETAKLFPTEDVMRIDSASRKAFFHESGGEYDKELNTRVVDLSRKIIVFTDQPRTELLAELRPLLSHDNKIHISKISDKNQKGGHETKTVHIKGYPVFVYCTANSQYDEQEATRFIVLSPETHQDKLSAGISQAIRSSSVSEEFKNEIDANPHRIKLIDRVKLIKFSGINDIIVPQHEAIENIFKANHPNFKPRHMRDSKKVIGFVKAFALLNFHNRNKVDNTIFTTQKDVDNAFELWYKISTAQDLGVSPQIADILTKVIMPIYQDKIFNEAGYKGVSRGEICYKYRQVFNLELGINKLRMEYLPALEGAGLILQVPSDGDGRILLVVPNYSEGMCRVNIEDNHSVQKFDFDINSSGQEFVNGMKKVAEQYDIANN